ncbi:MAG TPA: NAD-dependent succinate-semialdehyde dehydrogenase [Bauldia sp.]|nr:NAD-dependent succinate-semialdehyde dehydrogenase [Bauldia sp.]
MYDAFGLYIDGVWRQAHSGKTYPVIDPATEEPVGNIPVADEVDLDLALAAAHKGLRTWRSTPPWERAARLRRAADLMRQRVDDIARIITLETGKPLAEAKGETTGAADQFEWYAEETKRIYGQTIEGRSPDQRHQVIYQPVGVVAAFSAWNFPILLPARKIAAALGAGCSIIVKPAEEAPGSCMALVQACHDAGIPPGALNLVVGDPKQISAYLIASPIVRKVSFTGSVPVGKELLRLCADGVKKVSMELGGHAPVIVFEDADPVAAARAAGTAKFRNGGQVCIAPSRFYVHDNIRPAFGAAMAELATSLKVGSGMEPSTQVGPLANPRGLNRAKALVADAIDKGATLLAGGGPPHGINRGYFFEPTVLTDVPEEARIMQEEPFVPIAPIVGFSDFDDVIERANSVPFGLAAYLFTRSLRTATLASEAIEAGMVGVNEMLLASAEAPFGGIKESGMGREGGALGIKDYLEPKYVKFRI